MEFTDTIRARDGVEVTVRDANGNVVEPTPTPTPTPAPSRAQLWMRAAALDPEVGSALRYIRGNPGWVELYKAYEALGNKPNGGISGNEIERFRRTANQKERHHPSDKIAPHKRPMELWEGRAFVTQWISAAIDDILTKNP